MKSALIFRESLLPKSETFIVDQASALRRYRPVLTGLYRVPSGKQSGFEEVLLTERAGTLGRAAVLSYRYLNFAPGFFHRLHAISPSLIHAHFATDAVNALALADALKIPLVVSLHGYDATTTDAHFASTPRGRSYLRRRERLFRRASRFLCVSEFIRQKALAAGYPAEKLTVHYTGVDRSRFQPVAGIERDPYRILFVGRLVEKKGCADLVAAMEKVQAVVPQAHLEVIGDGPLLPKLQTFARERKIAVNFRGAQDHAEVCRSMARSRVLCNPSVAAPNGDSEGFGMVFAEAQALGTPVVSTRHGGIPEAVCDGYTGLLCNEHDPQQLSEALLRFLQDDAFWTASSRCAVEWVEKNFDLHTQTARLEQIYEEA